MDPVLSLENVVKTYDSTVRAVDGVSLELSAGDFVTLVGRSGCGKSTLLHLAGAMDHPDSGTVRVAGEQITNSDDAKLTRIRREKTGFIFQSFQLLPALSVAENVELPLMLAGRSGDAVRQAAIDRLREVDMADLANRMPYQLSGGQQQRVAIARALVHAPKLLLADEPTGNLDSATGDHVLRLLQAIAGRGTAILMATHSTEAAAASHRVLRMRDGRIEA